jgi:hypothetical protein
MTVSTFFVEIFGDKKVFKDANIHTLKIGYDPVEHIQHCESKWQRIGYKDERVWLLEIWLSLMSTLINR